MKFRPSRAVKITVAIAIVIVIGLSVNALTPSSQYTNISFLSANPPSPFISSEDVVKRVTLPTTTTQTLAGQRIGGVASVTETSSIRRMEIFSAQMYVEVKDVQSALTQVASIAQQLDGYVAGSSVSLFGSRETATITIRVPRDRFYQAVGTVESLGELKDKATQSDDVTEEYIDITARRDNLQKQEERLQEVLALAKNVDEVLNVERELERVRGEVERLTGRINYLEGNVALSTIMITFTQPAESPLPELDWAEPFTIGITALYATIRGLVIFAFAAAPFAVIGTPTYLVYRYRRNRHTQGEDTSQKSV